MLAISTMWNALRRPDGAALLDELKELGFDAIELSRHLTREQIEQIKPHLATTRDLLHPQLLSRSARSPTTAGGG